MNANKKHLTEISGSDLREIAAAANAQGGDGIVVSTVGDRMEISIDKNAFEHWVKVIMQGGNLK